MRDFKNMKRQRGRNRGGGNSGGSGKPQQNANRAFDSNGPDNVKIRGHAQHVFEKYQQLARDAFSSGDRVLAENYLQHADHYFRVLRTIQPQRSPSEILGRDVLASGLDIDFEEEFEPAEEGGEAAMETGAEANGAGEPTRVYGEPRREGYDRDARDNRYEPRREGVGDNGYRQDQSRGDYRQDRGGEPRQDRGYDNRQGGYNSQGGDRQGGDRQGSDRQGGDRQGGDRQDRYEGRRDNRRFEGRRDERPYGRDRDRGYGERNDAPPTDPLAVVAPEPAQPFPSAAADAQPSPVLRSQDGGMSEAPAFLQMAEEGERKSRPRRRRTPRSFEGSEGGEDVASLAEADDA